MADELEACLRKSCEVFGIPELFAEQKKAITSFLKKEDVFLNLPTGYGKSLVFQMTPLVHSELAKIRNHSEDFTSHPIVVVISPLKSLMEDQITYLRGIGLKAAAIGDDPEENQKILHGEFNLVYTSPESILANSKWRNMLKSPTYQESLIGIVVDEAHCISHWGTSRSQNAIAFRHWFFKLSELRSLVHNKVPFMAVTATATEKTKSIIIDVLRLRKGFSEVKQSPNKDNLAFSVIYMDKKYSILDYFKWILKGLKEKNEDSARSIIYCQTIKQCANLYSLFVTELGTEFIVDKENPRRRKVEMIHSLSPNSVKKNILTDMSKEDGYIKILICTIAFGMGVNCRGVSTVIHFGPSKSVEAYIQESGRAGRDGSQSNAILLFRFLMLLNVEKDMRDYVRGKTYNCRRQYLMSFFESANSSAGKCESNQKCDKCHGDTSMFMPILENVYDGPTRHTDPDEMEKLKNKLIIFRKLAYADIVKKVPDGKLPLITIPELLIAFSDNQISQIVTNCDKIFTLKDVYKFVEIWKRKHAISILKIINEVFGDLDNRDENESSDDEDDSTEFDDDEDLWNIVMPNEELMDIDWHQLSHSGIFLEDLSMLEASADLGDIDPYKIPDIVTNMLDDIHMD